MRLRENGHRSGQALRWFGEMYHGGGVGQCTWIQLHDAFRFKMRCFVQILVPANRRVGCRVLGVAHAKGICMEPCRCGGVHARAMAAQVHILS